MNKYNYYILGPELTQEPEQSFFFWIADSSILLTSAQLIAAFVTAGATIALFMITRVLAAETKTLAKMTSQPFVTCSLQSSVADSLMFDLIIENTGNAVAFDIKVTIDPALPAYNGAQSSENKETVINISILPPGFKLPKNGVQSKHVLDAKFSARIEWKLRPDAVKTETLQYTFTADDGYRSGWGVKGVHQLVQEVEKIGRKIS